MAVTIDEMQVDVQQPNTQPKGAQAEGSSKETPKTPTIAQQLDMLAERALRLKAN